MKKTFLYWFRRTRFYWWATLTFKIPRLPNSQCQATNRSLACGLRCENFADDGKDCGTLHRAGGCYWKQSTYSVAEIATGLWPTINTPYILNRRRSLEEDFEFAERYTE